MRIGVSREEVEWVLQLAERRERGLKRNLFEDVVGAKVLVELDGGPAPGCECQELCSAEAADPREAMLMRHDEAPFKQQRIAASAARKLSAEFQRPRRAEATGG